MRTLLLVILSALLNASALAQGPPPTSVRVAKVEVRDLQERREVTGELRAVARSNVATIEAGRVVSIDVREGDVVKRGDVLASLDTRRLELALEQVRAELDVAAAVRSVRDAEREQTERVLELLVNLEERQASNIRELIDARAEAVVAQSRYEQSLRDVSVLHAQERLLQVRIEDGRILAPFDGVVVTKSTEAGQWVAEGDSIAEILGTSMYEVRLNVPQEFAAALQPKEATIIVRLDAGRTIGPVRPRIVPDVDRVGRTFSVLVDVEDEAKVLKPGMSVTGWIPTGAMARYPTIPRDALLEGPTGQYVYIARSDGEGPAIAAQVNVHALFDDGDRVAIRGGGLAAGDLVVVEGNERLFPMRPISPQPVEPDAVTADGG